MHRRSLALVPLALAAVTVSAQGPSSGLTRMLEAELARFPAKTGVYVKHLGTGEEAGVRAGDAFSSASVIKVPIMIRAFQLADEGTLDLNERVEIRREDLRDGSGVLQYHDVGLRPTYRDLITEMVITSDNTATDLMVRRIGGVDALNAWLKASGYPNAQMVGRGHEYRKRLLTLLDPEFASLTPEETTGLQYASQDNPLFDLYTDLFAGSRARWIATVRDPQNRRTLAEYRNRLTVEDRHYWLGDMTPRETGRLLEAIERGTLTSKASAAAMKTIMGRQQAGSRRIPHFLDVPVAHKTGDSGVIANDVGLVSARSGTVIISFFVNGITGPYAETEDRVGRVSRQIVDYFDGGGSRTASRGPLTQHERMTQLERTVETSANVSIGDVNDDGHADIVLAKGRHWPLVDRVRLGDGRGGFPLAYDLGAASDRTFNVGSGRQFTPMPFGDDQGTYGFAIGDLDADGLLDIAVPRSEAPNASAQPRRAAASAAAR